MSQNDLLQYALEKVGELANDLQAAVKDRDLGVMVLVLRLLAALWPEINELKAGLKKEPQVAEGKKTEVRRDALSDEQISLLNLLFGLGGEKQITFIEACKKIHPEMKEVFGGIAKASQYVNLYGIFRYAMAKLEKVIGGEVKINSLPQNNQQFYQELEKKYPGKSFDELLRLVTRRSPKQKEVAGKQKPFRSS